MTHLNVAMTILLNGVWQGALLAAVIWITLKLFPRVNPTTRFTVLWLTLLAVVVMPVGPLALRAPATGLWHASLATVGANTVETTRFVPAEVREVPTTPAATSESASEPGMESRSTTVVAAPIAPAATATDEHSPIQISSRRVLAGFAILWAGLVLLMITRLGAGWRLLRRLKAAAMPCPENWRVRLVSLSAMNGVRRHVKLLVSDEITAPMSLGFLDPAILIPRSLFDTLSETEIDHIVLHELAHLLRYDDWTNLAQKLIEALLPIQPAVFWLGGRMSLEREMACDDWVIEATGTAKPYAACLTKVAELAHWQRAGVLAAGAAGNRSQLFCRVQHMLDRTRDGAPRLSFGPVAVALIAVVALICEGARAPRLIAFAQNSTEESGQTVLKEPQAPVAPVSPSAPMMSSSGWAPAAPSTGLVRLALPSQAAPVAPASPLAPKAPAESLQQMVSQRDGETHMHITERNATTSLDVQVDGTIEFTDDDRDVKSLSPNGHFRLEEGGWFSGRTYDVKSDSAGNLTKTYFVGRTAKPLDDDGRAWLGRLLPQLIRDSGVGAGPRVARILRQGGPQAALTEIGLIHSDGSRRIYLEQLFSQTPLNTAQLEDAAKLTQGISSDGDKAQVIIAVDSKYFTHELRPRLFEVAESISSDGDKRRVLSDIAGKDAANSETLLGVAKAAHHIASDGDKAEVLIEIADHYQANDELRGAYFEAVDSISSDGDHARVLSKLLAARGNDHETMVRVLRSARRIASDGDKARVLIESVSSYTDDESERAAFLDAANSISSDGDHQRVLVALVHGQGIGTATLGGIANSAERISSDGDKAHVLMELAVGNVETIRDPFFAAADSIHSDGDRARVLLAILDKPGISTATVLGAIHSATGISSDGDKGRVLLDAAKRYSKDPTVSEALRHAIDGIHSDGEYRAVMTELARGGGNG